MVDWPGTMGKARISEWLWRFLAAVILFAVGWTMWIMYQINPAPLITDAAFRAAAAAKASSGQTIQGIITPAVPPEPPKAEGAAPKEPPRNTEARRSCWFCS